MSYIDKGHLIRELLSGRHGMNPDLLTPTPKQSWQLTHLSCSGEIVSSARMHSMQSHCFCDTGHRSQRVIHDAMTSSNAGWEIW